MHVLPLFISHEPNSVFPRKAIIHEKVRAHPDTSASTDNVYSLARYHVHMADSKISVDKKSDPKDDLECLVMTQAPFITHFFLFFSSEKFVLMIDTQSHKENLNLTPMSRKGDDNVTVLVNTSQSQSRS